jgi:hypothetical protein
MERCKRLVGIGPGLPPHGTLQFADMCIAAEGVECFEKNDFGDRKDSGLHHATL